MKKILDRLLKNKRELVSIQMALFEEGKCNDCSNILSAKKTKIVVSEFKEFALIFSLCEKHFIRYKNVELLCCKDYILDEKDIFYLRVLL